MNTLTQKERLLLNDEKSHEELCIKKYSNYAQQAQDPELKDLFKQLEGQERTHLDTINQILAGQIPSVGQGQTTYMGTSAQQNQGNKIRMEAAQEWQPQQNANKTGLVNQPDIDLCSDMLATEKYVSSTYDTTIFECTNSQIRNALNHIQKEEQQHGEKLFNYMKKKGAYNTQGS